MTNKQAYERARKAVEKACKDSDRFCGGSMASNEIMALLYDALRVEFTKQEFTE